MQRTWSPLLERIAAASLLVVVLVIIARISTPDSLIASPDSRESVNAPPTATTTPRRPNESKHEMPEFALVGELEGREHIVRVYAGDPLRYTVLDKQGRVLCRLERAEVVMERFPEIPLRDLLSEQAPALMRVDPSAADIRY